MSFASDADTLLLHFKSIRPGGEVFEDTTESGPVSVTLGKKQINPAFEEALIGKEPGNTVTVVLPPEKAYGTYKKRLIVALKRKKLNLDHEPQVGEFIPVDVLGQQCRVTVVEVTPTKIVVDGNHPLAGETITYQITIVKNLSHDS